MTDEVAEALRLLADVDPVQRVRGLDLIGDLRPDGAYDIVSAYLHDPDRGVRLSAALNLGDIGDPQAIPTLIAVASTSDDKDMRDQAIRALDAWRDDRILRLLLQEVERAERSWVVLRAVAFQLGKYRGDEVVDALFTLLWDDEVRVQDAAAQSLLGLNDHSLRGRWERASRADDELVRSTAEAALADLDRRH